MVLLDLRTIYVVGAVVYMLLGVLQLLAYATGRFERWPLWWGLSSLLLGLGTFAISLQSFIPEYIAIDLGNAATLTGYMLLVVAVRVFAGQPIRVWRCALGVAAAALPATLFFHGPAHYADRLAYLSVFLGFWDLSIAREGVRLARKQNLATAWILVGLFVPTTLLYAARALLAMTHGLDSGGGLFAPGNSPHVWMAVPALAFIFLRGIVLVMMAAERTRNELMDLAQTDPLTGALNRAGLNASFAILPKMSAVCALVIDVDHFKTLNDTHGHAAGDRVLQLFVAAARAEIRVDDVVVRQGGDEFVVLLPKADLSAAITVANRIRNAFQARVQAEMQFQTCPTLSIGVAEGRVDAAGHAALLQRADEAVYRSKRAGRDRVEVCLAALEVA
jgi:diguanylate cyclase (GGDEF)-like protein